VIRPVLAWAAVAVLVVAACSKPPGARDDDAFGRQVRAYLLQHPEVIEEATAKLNAQRRQQALAQSRTALDGQRAALEHDPHDFVANPDGKVTVVEFFDYRCPYCKAALPDLDALIRTNKDVRFVFKELPILPDANGQVGVSLRAARAALAAIPSGKYLQVHDAMMADKPLDDAGIAKALKANGLNPAAVASTAADPHLRDVKALAEAVGVSGTPTFVVGDTLVEGNRMDELAAAIAQARKAAKG
jgi:protein-disulfide isomerase